MSDHEKETSSGDAKASSRESKMAKAVKKTSEQLSQLVELVGNTQGSLSASQVNITFAMMEGNPTSEKIKTLEGELLRMRNSGIPRDFNRLIHPKTKESITFLFSSYQLIGEDNTSEETWETWTDKDLVTRLRDIGKHHSVVRSTNEPGLTEAIDRMNRTKMHELNHDFILKIKMAMSEELDAAMAANPAKSATKTLRTTFLDIIKAVDLGKGVATRYLETESEKMVVTVTSDDTSASVEPKPDYSWNKFIRVMMNEFIIGTDKIVGAVIYGGTPLVNVTKTGSANKATPHDKQEDRPHGQKRKSALDYIEDRRVKAAAAASGAPTTASVIQLAQQTEKARRRAASKGLDCGLCGREFHTAETCRLRVDSLLQAKGHPDRNIEYRTTPWKNTRKAEEWAKRGEMFCPMVKQLDGGVYVPISTERTRDLNIGTLPIQVNNSFRGRGGRGRGRGGRGYSGKQPISYGCGLCNDANILSNIKNVLNHDIHDNELPYDEHGVRTCTLINSHNPDASPIRLKVLKDTGALGLGANYISEAAGKQLEVAGFKPRDIEEQMCSCFVGSCRTLKHLFKLRLKFFNEELNRDVTVTVKCRVADIQHDIIIGREKIRRCKKLKELVRLSLDSIDGDSSSTSSDSENSDTESSYPTSGIQYNEKIVKYKSFNKLFKRPEPDNSLNNNKLYEHHLRELEQCREEIVEQDSHEPWDTIVHPPSESVTYDDKGLKILNSIKVGEYIEPKEFGGPESLQRGAKLVCNKHKKIISKELNEVHADITPMKIRLSGDWGTRTDQQPPRQQSRLKTEEISVQTRNMLMAHVIAESQAPAHSQVMMTVKPNGTWRFCIDYRRLNVVSTPNSFPLPRIKDILERIGKKKPKYFAVIDLTKGYYQAPLDKESRHLTAFITPHGKFEWLRVAMGLQGAPSYFQRAMANEVLYGLVRQICEVYLDDIIIYGATEEEFLANLDTVLTRLEEKRITINPDKCRIGLTSIEYVGHVIDETGVSFSKEKIAKAISIELPETTSELKTFCGVVNYFREHCHNGAARMEPLNNLLKGYNKKVKVKIRWESNLEARRAFEDVKDMVNNLPKLFFVDETSPVHLCTDASKKGIGAYLYQIVDEVEVPIGFYSKSLNDTEKRWGVPELEGYAIYAAFKHWDYLLRDAHTHVHTDHKNLVYIRDTGSEKVIRWKMMLQEYSFDLDYLPGIDNPIADYWSRNEAAEEDNYVVETPAKVANMLCTVWHTKTVTNFVHATKTGKSWAKFEIPDLAYEMIEDVHNVIVGHHGVNDTLHKLAEKGNRWFQMREHVKRFINECDLCQKATFRHHQIKVPKYTTGSYLPMERWNMDTIGPFPPDRFENRYVVVIIDCFTRFMGLYPSKTKDADEVAEIVLQHTGHYGVPSQILSDNGGEYVNNIIKELLELTGTEHIATIAHSHEENSIVERHNAEVSRWLREILYEKGLPITETDNNEWSKYLPFVQRIHNASKIGFLGLSPGQMLFGDRVQLDRSILLPPENRNPGDGAEVTAWMSEQRNIQDKILLKAKTLQKEKDERHLKLSTDGQLPEYTIYEDGSYVLQDYPDSGINLGRPNKLHLMRTGPYKVIAHTGNMYTVQNLITEEHEIKGVWLLRPFNYDPKRTDPRKVALKDKADNFDAEKILSHKGVWSRKTHMKFIVKWEGYDDTYNTEEPWTNVSHSRAMLTYLAELKLENLAPGYVADANTPGARKLRKRKLTVPK